MIIIVVAVVLIFTTTPTATIIQVVLAIANTAINPQRLVVQAWTSQCDYRVADGQWHWVELSYIGEERDGNDDVRHVYGQSVIITSDRDFEFTYRLKVNCFVQCTIIHSFTH